MTGQRRDDRGSTLVELSVAMLVFGVFAALLSTTVLQTTRQTRESAVREVTTQRASTLMQQLTKDLRSAVRVGPTADAAAFRRAQADRVDFTSSVTPDVVLETLCFQAVCDAPLPARAGLHRVTRPPDATSVFPELTYTSTTATSRLLEHQLTSTAVFRYDVRKPDPVTGVPTDTTVSSVPPADLKHISAVHVVVRLDGDDAGRLPAVELTSTVRPYNP